MQVQRVYCVNRRQGKEYLLNGTHESTGDPKTPNLCQSFSTNLMESTFDLPPAVDMRGNLSPVKDQGHNQSCVANALAGCFEYLLRKANSYDDDVSCLFIYYNARLKKKPEKIADVGCTVTEGIEALADAGVCHQDLWPFEMENLNVRPSTEAYDSARLNYIKDAYKLNQNLQELKMCLAQGYPITFGARLFKSFENVHRTGIIEKPSFSEPTRGEHPKHAMLIVGYDDSKKAFLVRNSWGKDWVNEGYAYMVYDYMLDSAFSFDFWTFRTLNSTPIKRDHWTEKIDWDFEADRSNEKEDDGSCFRYCEEKIEEKKCTSVYAEASSEVSDSEETGETIVKSEAYAEVHTKVKRSSKKSRRESRSEEDTEPSSEEEEEENDDDW